jgi:hypothetical protein
MLISSQPYACLERAAVERPPDRADAAFVVRGQLDNRFAGSIALADDTLLACIERLWTAKLRTLCLGPFRFTKLPGGERFVLGDASQIIGAESQDWIAQFR